MSTRTNRIAVFADLHYTCGSATLKGRVLREALDAALSLGAGGVVCAGDMLGTGTVAEATALRAIFDAQPLPVWFTPGNAELRTPSESAAADAILANRAPLPDGVILIDSSAGWAAFAAQPVESRKSKVESQGTGHSTFDIRHSTCGAERSAPLLAVTHVPPDAWGQAPFAAWRDAVARGAIGLTVAGHLHIDDVRENGACRLLRGLDPDKAIGGPPAFATFVRDESGVWHFEADHEIAGIRPAEWTSSFRDAFLRDLGLSTMYDPFGGLAFATAERVECVELRHASWGDDARPLMEAIARWRASGGRVLSMHLPSLRFPPEGPQGVESVRDACATARDIGCNRVTLHVPGIPARDFVPTGMGNGERGTGNGEQGTGKREEGKGPSAVDLRSSTVMDSYAQALAPLVGTGVAIGIENLHMSPGATPDNRNYGYTPDECQAFINALRTLPGLDIGFHLDIGHARNNAPYSSLFPVGAWYETLGSECNGMHIHQVVKGEQGKLQNHRPLLGFFDKLIALSSLILARRDGLLRPVPMFLEVRDGRGPESLLALRTATTRQGTQSAVPS